MKRGDSPLEAPLLTLREDTSPMALAPLPRQLLLATADAALGARLARLLDLIGHGVDRADSARQALQRWRAGGVELLLLDSSLPDMDGRALARLLRADESSRGLPRLPIVALRRAAPGFDRLPGADIDDALQQPVHIPTLQAVLQRWLPPRDGPVAAQQRAAGARAAPQVDLAVLQRLVGRDPGVLRETLLDYLASAHEQAGLLRRAYHQGDQRQVGALAHKLKSASLAVGALALGELCATLEQPTHTDFDAAESDHARFDRVFEATVAGIETHIQRLSR